MSEQNAIDPMFLAIHQLQVNAQSVEQYMMCAYDSRYSPEQRRAAIAYLFAQTRQIEEMCNRLYAQFRTLDLNCR